MPKPRPGQTKDEYINFCMSSAEARNTAPNVDHRYAMCNGMWENSQKGIDTTLKEELEKYLKKMKKRSSNY